MACPMPRQGPRRRIIVAALFALGGLGCQNDLSEPEPTGHMPTKTIQQVQEEHTDAWMAIPGVVGTAIGQCEGRPCIVVMTASRTEQVRQRIPTEVEGYPVVVRYVGEIRALDE
jgi:hypothetical protein